VHPREGQSGLNASDEDEPEALEEHPRSSIFQASPEGASQMVIESASDC
jgi:hypothetical protein